MSGDVPSGDELDEGLGDVDDAIIKVDSARRSLPLVNYAMSGEEDSDEMEDDGSLPEDDQLSDPSGSDRSNGSITPVVGGGESQGETFGKETETLVVIDNEHVEEDAKDVMERNVIAEALSKAGIGVLGKCGLFGGPDKPSPSTSPADEHAEDVSARNVAAAAAAAAAERLSPASPSAPFAGAVADEQLKQTEAQLPPAKGLALLVGIKTRAVAAVAPMPRGEVTGIEPIQRQNAVRLQSPAVAPIPDVEQMAGSVEVRRERRRRESWQVKVVRVVAPAGSESPEYIPPPSTRRTERSTRNRRSERLRTANRRFSDIRDFFAEALLNDDDAVDTEDDVVFIAETIRANVLEDVQRTQLANADAPSTSSAQTVKMATESVAEDAFAADVDESVVKNQEAALVALGAEQACRRKLNAAEVAVEHKTDEWMKQTNVLQTLCAERQKSEKTQCDAARRSSTMKQRLKSHLARSRLVTYAEEEAALEQHKRLLQGQAVEADEDVSAVEDVQGTLTEADSQDVVNELLSTAANLRKVAEGKRAEIGVLEEKMAEIAAKKAEEETYLLSDVEEAVAVADKVQKQQVVVEEARAAMAVAQLLVERLRDELLTASASAIALHSHAAASQAKMEQVLACGGPASAEASSGGPPAAATGGGPATAAAKTLKSVKTKAEPTYKMAGSMPEDPKAPPLPKRSEGYRFWPGYPAYHSNTSAQRLPAMHKARNEQQEATANANYRRMPAVDLAALTAVLLSFAENYVVDEKQLFRGDPAKTNEAQWAFFIHDKLALIVRWVKYLQHVGSELNPFFFPDWALLRNFTRYLRDDPIFSGYTSLVKNGNMLFRVLIDADLFVLLTKADMKQRVDERALQRAYNKNGPVSLLAMMNKQGNANWIGAKERELLTQMANGGPWVALLREVCESRPNMEYDIRPRLINRVNRRGKRVAEDPSFEDALTPPPKKKTSAVDPEASSTSKAPVQKKTTSSSDLVATPKAAAAEEQPKVATPKVVAADAEAAVTPQPVAVVTSELTGDVTPEAPAAATPKVTAAATPTMAAAATPKADVTSKAPTSVPRSADSPATDFDSGYVMLGGKIETLAQTRKRVQTGSPSYLLDTCRCPAVMQPPNPTDPARKAYWAMNEYCVDLCIGPSTLAIKKQLSSRLRPLLGAKPSIEVVLLERAETALTAEQECPTFWYSEDVLPRSSLFVGKPDVVALVVRRKGHSCASTYWTLLVTVRNAFALEQRATFMRFVETEMRLSVQRALPAYVCDSSGSRCKCQTDSESQGGEGGSGIVYRMGCRSRLSAGSLRCTQADGARAKVPMLDSAPTTDQAVMASLQPVLDRMSNTLQAVAPIAYRNMTLFDSVATDCRLAPRSPFSWTTVGVDVSQHAGCGRNEMVGGLTAATVLIDASPIWPDVWPQQGSVFQEAVDDSIDTVIFNWRLERINPYGTNLTACELHLESGMMVIGAMRMIRHGMVPPQQRDQRCPSVVVVTASQAAGLYKAAHGC